MWLFYILTTILVIVLTPFIWWYLTLKQFKSLDKVPGPKPLPIIGNGNVVGATTVDLLESLARLQKEYGTVMKLWLGPRLHLMIAKPEVAEYFLTSNVHISKSSGYDLYKPWLRDGLLISTGNKWKTRRKMITPTFHFKILEQFLDVFNKQLDILLNVLKREVEKTEEHQSIEIYQFVNLCSLDIICETAFGSSINAQLKSNTKYVEALSGFLEILVLRFFSVWMRNPLLFRLFSNKYDKYAEYLKILHDFTNNIIQQRKKEFELMRNDPKAGEDCGIKKRAALLDMLLEVSENGKVLSDEDIREEVDTFMFEGHDTISSAICFALYAIGQHPNVQKRIYDELIAVLGANPMDEIKYGDLQELKYLEIVIKEAQRIYPPVPLIERSIETDCFVDGITIPKGTNITLFIYGMNYNSRIFPNPEKFDPERFLPQNQKATHNYAYIPFSAGPRNCIGQKFAMLEVKATLAKFLRCFEVEADPEFPAQLGIYSVLKSKNGIHMKLKRRGVTQNRNCDNN